MSSLTLAALLASCGQSAQDAIASHAAHQIKPAQAPIKAGTVGDPDMVGAVSAAGASITPISMKFKLGGRPIVSTPLQLTISVLPASDVAITHLRVSLQPGDGLQLQSARTLDVTDPAAGVSIQQELTVVPQQNGVLNLNATVLVDTESGSMTRTYSIPLIAVDSHS